MHVVCITHQGSSHHRQPSTWPWHHVAAYLCPTLWRAWKGSSFPLSFAKKAAKFLSEEQMRSKRSKKSIGDDDDGGMEEGAEYEKGDLEVASEAL